MLVVLAESAADVAGEAQADDLPLDHVQQITQVRERHRDRLRRGAARGDRAAPRAGRRTARENVNLVEEGSFVEYGALTIAAQRRRRSLDDLITRTPANGLVMGTAMVDGRSRWWPDYSVLRRHPRAP